MKLRSSEPIIDAAIAEVEELDAGADKDNAVVESAGGDSEVGPHDSVISETEEPSLPPPPVVTEPADDPVIEIETSYGEGVREVGGSDASSSNNKCHRLYE